MKKENNIIVIDDDPNDLEFIIRFLNKSKLNVNIFDYNDSEIAIDYLLKRGVYKNRDPIGLIKLIIIDLKLPKMGGLKILKILRSFERTQNIPMVILTSSNLDLDVGEAYKHGASSYVIKPIDTEDFEKTIIQIAQYWLNLNIIPE